MKSCGKRKIDTKTIPRNLSRTAGSFQMNRLVNPLSSHDLRWDKKHTGFEPPMLPAWPGVIRPGSGELTDPALPGVVVLEENE